MNFLAELSKLFGKGSSSQAAKNRLQLVLVHDRAGLDAGRIEMLRKELVEVLSRYVAIDGNSVEIQVHRESGFSALVVNTPLRIS